MANKYIVAGTAMLSILLFLFISDLSKLYFLNDDNIFIPASQHFHYLYGTSFRPVSDILLFIDYSLWGTAAAGYHVTNFILHLVTTLLVFVFADVLFEKYDINNFSRYKAPVTAILFFFYPFHSEAVFWILGRGALLGGMFGVASLIFYLLRSKGKWYLPAAIGCFVTGAFAYETIWIIPLLIIVLTYFDIKQQPLQKSKLLWNAVIFWSFFLLYLLARGNIIGEIGGSPYGSAAIMTFSLPVLIKNYNILLARSFLPPMQSGWLLMALYVCLLAAAFLLFSSIKRQKKNICCCHNSFCCVVNFVFACCNTGCRLSRFGIRTVSLFAFRFCCLVAGRGCFYHWYVCLTEKIIFHHTVVYGNLFFVGCRLQL